MTLNPDTLAAIEALIRLRTGAARTGDTGLADQLSAILDLLRSETGGEAGRLAEATAIIEDIAILTYEEDDSRPLLDDLPVELGDRIAAFLNRPAALPPSPEAD